MMLIYKFGGSILEDSRKINKIYRLINRKIKNDKVIVIVSAIGRDKPFSTNTLIKESSYLSNVEKDALLSIGEQYSSLKLSNYLNQKGVRTRAVLLNELSFV